MPRDAENSGLEDCFVELKAYREEAGVDWVQFESPHSIEEIRRARALSERAVFVHEGQAAAISVRSKSISRSAINIAWFPGFTHHVLWAALWDFMTDFQSRGIAAWEDFRRARRGRPYPEPLVGPEEERRRRCSKNSKSVISGAGRMLRIAADERQVQTCASNGSKFG